MKRLAILITIAIMCMSDFAEAAPAYTTNRFSKCYVTTFSDGADSCRIRTKRKPKVQFVSTKKLTAKMLTRRKGTIYVECDHGVVLNRKGDGRDYCDNYVCYKRLGKLPWGTKVRSWFVYNPDTNYVDDVIFRFDKIVK